MSKTRQWATLTAVVCLAVLAAGWFLVVKPQRAHASSLRSQAQDVRSQSAQLHTQISQLRQQQRDLPAQQKLLSEIASKIPDNPALPSLIRQLSAAADGAGVNLVSLAPGQPTLTGAAAAPASTAATGKTTGTTTPTKHSLAPSSPLADISLTIQVQGSYFNVEQFFAAVESLNRAMLVTGFTLSPANGGVAASRVFSAPSSSSASLPPGTLTAQISANVFESPSVAVATVPATSTSSTGH
jgi:Tfp pilus assembly protein PilO